MWFSWSFRCLNSSYSGKKDKQNSASTPLHTASLGLVCVSAVVGNREEHWEHSDCRLVVGSRENNVSLHVVLGRKVNADVGDLRALRLWRQLAGSGQFWRTGKLRLQGWPIFCFKSQSRPTRSHIGQRWYMFSSVRVYPCFLWFLLSIDGLAVSEAAWGKD